MKPIARSILAAAAAASFSVTAEAADISGTVTGPRGPEAGVWVIAETTELPTRFARIVVTPRTMKYTFVDTCYNTHHLQFDGQDRL
jgi:hypothetical protein